MSELYLEKNPFQSSNVDSKVDTPVIKSVIEDVEASGKTYEILGQDIPNFDETLGVEKSNPADTLRKSILNPSAVVNSDVGASTKAI
ncbi:hypothetical protein A2U01_0038320, partial [Trifolium medium]|nr:hypothetical protein [Trifolium medium]